MESLKIKDLSVQALFPQLKFKLSLNLKAGEIIAINGPSGVGKSLIFKAITDLINHQGQIYLDQQNKNAFSAPLWRKKVMLVPAESQWWYETIGEHFHNIDNKLLTKLGFNQSTLALHSHQLSSGEKQRLALLRAIQHQPEVLLLDEPTANLDKHNSSIIEDFAVDYIKNKCAILWISHNIEQLKRIAHGVININRDSINLQQWK